MNNYNNKLLASAIILGIVFMWAALFYGKIMNVNFKIVGHGMNPTLEEFDFARIEKANKFKRGDIVIYHPPISIPNCKRYNICDSIIGRVVATEKEIVSIKNNTVLINDKEIIEPYINLASEYADLSSSIKLPINVPINHYFILQDKRFTSYGSHIFGAISSSQIIGKISKVYKKSSLSPMDWIVYITGVILMLLFTCTPFIFYRRTASIIITKILMILQIGISILMFLMIVTLLILDQTAINKLWFLPLFFYHNINGLFEFIFASSEIAVFLTVLSAWAGGILSILELSKYYKHKFRDSIKDVSPDR
jgi:signal peptidase I